MVTARVDADKNPAACLLYLEEVAMDVAFYNWLRLRDQLGQGEDGEDREEEGDEGDEEEEEEE
ncbi:MAG: hypothetical protein M1822_008975 [Bathelium mastoideum]|nr:MAG: hypothetical protein M1822_008975 [Bathelium mastoideum]